MSKLGPLKAYRPLSRLPGVSSILQGGGGAAFDPGFTAVTAAPYYLLGPDRLLPTFSGATIRLRRRSDSAEQDFTPAANGRLDVAAIQAWAGFGNPYVVSLYDQSGNGRNAPQATQANQPVLVLDDTVAPFIRTNGTTNFLYGPMADFGKNQPGASIGLAGRALDTSINQSILQHTDGNAGEPRVLLRLATTSQYTMVGKKTDGGASATATSTVVDDRTQHRAISGIFDHTANTIEVNVDGTVTSAVGGGTGTFSNTSSADGLIIGANGSFPTGWALQEFAALVGYNSALSGNDKLALNAALVKCKPSKTYLNLTNVKIVTDGNSQTATGAQGQTDWPATMITLPGLKSGMGRTLFNPAVAGQTIDNMLSDAVSQIDAAFNASVPNVLTVWEDVNAFSSYTARQYVDKLWQYVDGRLAAHPWSVVMIVGGADGNSARTTERHAMADLVLAEYKAHGVKSVLDLRSIPQTQDYTNTTYFYQGDGLNLHYSTAANNLIAAAMRDRILDLAA